MRPAFKKKMMKNPFVLQTALDYDLDYDLVLYLYQTWFDAGKFYEKLEEQLKEQSNG